jgi:hypothetical protein
MVSKGALSRELFRDNKENYRDKDVSVGNNSEYIKSLYRKYLGKEEVGTRPPAVEAEGRRDREGREQKQGVRDNKEGVREKQREVGREQKETREQRDSCAPGMIKSFSKK